VELILADVFGVEMLRGAAEVVTVRGA